MDCFLDYIKVKADVDREDNPSGLYVIQLPGITLKMIESVVETEQATWEKLFIDIKTRALRRFSKDYKTKFTNKYVGYCFERENCEPEFIACNNMEHFAEPWWYCLGVELMIERIYSSRLNRYTSIDKDQASELRDYYTVEYEKSINHAIKYIPKEIIHHCFDCRSGIDYVERLP